MSQRTHRRNANYRKAKKLVMLQRKLTAFKMALGVGIFFGTFGTITVAFILGWK